MVASRFKKGDWVTKRELRAQGWTDAGMKRLLGKPDAKRPNPKGGAPVPLYSVARVQTVTKTLEYAAWKANVQAPGEPDAADQEPVDEDLAAEFLQGLENRAVQCESVTRHRPSSILCYERFVLRHGRRYEQFSGTHKDEPSEFGNGACFANALLLANRRPELLYVEGFATLFNITLHHAWCVTASGEVVDTTWREPRGGWYFGVPFHREYAGSRLLRMMETGWIDSLLVGCTDNNYELLMGTAVGWRLDA